MKYILLIAKTYSKKYGSEYNHFKLKRINKVNSNETDHYPEFLIEK